MKRYRQSLEEILLRLTPLESNWCDEFAEAVIHKLLKIKNKNAYSEKDIEDLLDINDGIFQDASQTKRFDVGLTAIQLLLDLSKDEFTYQIKQSLGGGGRGVTRWNNDRVAYLSALKEMRIIEIINLTINRPVTWIDVITERLKGGRGSAIKGQNRGRQLEDFVEDIVKKVFGEGNYKERCQFKGATGTSHEKCDFAIPDAKDPSILIEVKGYGATGSKQTDILGDITRIIQEKRNDTSFVLFTDGVTWKERKSDLSKLVELQNQGKILRIYTKSMQDEFCQDLIQLKKEHKL